MTAEEVKGLAKIEWKKATEIAETFSEQLATGKPFIASVGLPKTEGIEDVVVIQIVQQIERELSDEQKALSNMRPDKFGDTDSIIMMGGSYKTTSEAIELIEEGALMNTIMTKEKLGFEIGLRVVDKTEQSGEGQLPILRPNESNDKETFDVAVTLGEDPKPIYRNIQFGNIKDKHVTIKDRQFISREQYNGMLAESLENEFTTEPETEGKGANVA